MSNANLLMFPDAPAFGFIAAFASTLHGVRTSPFRARRGRGRENGVQKRVFREKLALDTLGAHKQHDQRPHGLDIGARRN